MEISIRLFLITLCIIMNCFQSFLLQGKNIEIKSPDNQVKIRIIGESQQLQYEVIYRGRKVIEPSNLGINVDQLVLGRSIQLEEPVYQQRIKECYPWRGIKSEVKTSYTLARIPVLHLSSETRYYLEVRAYPDGIAFRYVVPGSGKRTVEGEATSYQIPEGSTVWLQNQPPFAWREHVWQGLYCSEGLYEQKKVSLINAHDKTPVPITVELPGSIGYAAITEGALINYNGMTLWGGPQGSRTFNTEFIVDDNGKTPPVTGSWIMEDTIRSPWRVIMVGPDLNTLMNCDILSSVSPPPDPILYPEGINTSWLKPGRSIHPLLAGVGGDAERGSPEDHKYHIRKASKLGFEYILIDGFWRNWGENDQERWNLLQDVVQYAKQYNIAAWAWVYYGKILDEQERLEFFQRCRQIGVVGVKTDFLDSESKSKIDFLEACLRDAAKYHLMINFHGVNKPTGTMRTWPNELTREAICGMESQPRPQHNTIWPFTRLLAGHADFNPMNFSHRMTTTTWGHQLATGIIINAPLLHFSFHPDTLLKHPALEFVKSLPTTWDETIVLFASRIGEKVVFARRKGHTWFLAVVNGDCEHVFPVDLSFLGEGNYQAEIFRDVPRHTRALRMSKRMVTSNDMVTVEVPKGGGYAARFTKLTLNPNGGGFDDSIKVTIETVDPNGIVHYTLNGNVPTMDSPQYSGELIINRSVTLKAKIFQGDGKGAEVQARFNRMPVNKE